MSAFLLPSRNSTSRYCADWKPELVARNGRISAYSLGRQRREHRPLVGERVLDVLDPCHPLERGGEVVGAQQRAGRAQLVDHQLEPELAGLVLDDEEQLVVLRRVRQRLLGRQQHVEAQVVAVGHRLREVALDALLEVALVRVCRPFPADMGCNR